MAMSIGVSMQPPLPSNFKGDAPIVAKGFEDSLVLRYPRYVRYVVYYLE